MIKCELCKKEMKIITVRHLKLSHGLTMEKYIEKFPTAEIHSKEYRDAIRKREANIDRKSKFTDEVKKKISETKKKNYALGRCVPHMKGKHHSQDTIDKIMRTKKERAHLYNYDAVRKPHSEESKKRQSETVKAQYANGRVHFNKGKHWSDEVKKKISDSLKGNKLSKQTIEKIVASNKKYYETHESKLKGRLATAKQLIGAYRGSKISALSKRQKKINRIQKLCLENDIEILQHDSIAYWWNLKCKKCGNLIDVTAQEFRESKGVYTKLCPICYPRLDGYSAQEREVQKYIKGIYSKGIILNEKSMLGGKEIDIYLPDLKIGIEYDGLYWHSEDAHQHLNLWNKSAYAYKRDINLIHIFEDEWLYKNDIVKSKLCQILDVNQHIIPLNDFTIKEIDDELKLQFLGENCLEGNDVSLHNVGAFHGDALIAVMTFSPVVNSQLIKLSRFCVKKFTKVLNVEQKLFDYFLNHFDYLEIVAKSDLRWLDGKIYKQLGFEFVERIKPEYKFILENKRVEVDHLSITQGLKKVYDCGKLSWKYLR